eukprot:GHVU01147625.1.p1 GENE.GHVU01147625.1~~GHVU01147625.1.p1  ORF type:complete len:191 (+),score=2.19 GHVU01147625.1:180-752(+)
MSFIMSLMYVLRHIPSCTLSSCTHLMDLSSCPRIHVLAHKSSWTCPHEHVLAHKSSWTCPQVHTRIKDIPWYARIHVPNNTVRALDGQSGCSPPRDPKNLIAHSSSTLSLDKQAPARNWWRYCEYLTTRIQDNYSGDVKYYTISPYTRDSASSVRYSSQVPDSWYALVILVTIVLASSSFLFLPYDLLFS